MFGSRPVCYRNPCLIIFGSEVKALLPVGFPAQPDYSVIHDYLVYGIYEHSHKTFFDGVQQLPPGCVLIAQNSHVQVDTYWMLDANKETLPERDWNQQNFDVIFTYLFNSIYP